MQDKSATRTLSIRVPETLAAKLDAVADRHKMTRTSVLCQILENAIDTWQPATQDPRQPQDDTLAGAVETLRLELDETIERVDRLERARQLATRPARQTAIQPQDTATHPDAVTIAELRDRYGWDKSNAARKAESAGWVKVGKRGRQTIWIQR